MVSSPAKCPDETVPQTVPHAGHGVQTPEGPDSDKNCGAPLAMTGPLPSQGRAQLRFAGYAAVFGHADSGGDVIRRGAFAASLEAARDVPLLWQHKAGAVIGRVEHLSEDKRGLRVIASLGGGEDARRAARLLQVKKLDGLSFGYRVRQAGRKDGLRELIEVDLVEISLVAEPMQPRARVHAVESAAQPPVYMRGGD